LRRAAAGAALLALCCGCRPSPAAKTQLAQLNLRSWTATLRKTADALEQHAVPSQYARQVVQAARQSRADESAQPEWAQLPSQERAELDAALDQLAALTGQADAGESR
jgi:hypothetical protein